MITPARLVRGCLVKALFNSCPDTRAYAVRSYSPIAVLSALIVLTWIPLANAHPIVDFNDGATHLINDSTYHSNSIAVADTGTGDSTTVVVTAGAGIGTLFQTGLSHFGELSVSGSSSAFFSGGILGGDLVGLDQASLNVTDGQIGRIDTYRSSSLSMIGGEIRSLRFTGEIATWDNSTADLYGGSFMGLRARGNSTMNYSGGSGGHTVSSHDSATLNLNGGEAQGLVYAYDSSIVNLLSSTVGNFLNAENDSHIFMSGGSLGNGFTGNSFSTIELSGGTVNGELILNDAAHGDLLGGIVTLDLTVRDIATTQLGGTTIQGSATILNNAAFVMSGGSMAGTLSVQDFTDIQLNGGDIAGDFMAELFSTTVITETLIGGSLVVGDFASVEINGYGFKIDGVAIGEGAITALAGTLTGFYDSGSQFSNDFSRSNGSSIVLTTIPEPNTALMQGISVGLVCLAARRRSLRS